MIKERVVFLFYHGLGHINAFLKPAEILEQANYDVYFAGAGFFREYILKQHAKFYLLKSYPFGYGLEKWVNKLQKKRFIHLNAVTDKLTDRLYKEREVELFWMLEELKPSIVLIDSLQATDFIVLYNQLKRRSIRVAAVNSMLPTDVVEGYPPLNTRLLPHDSTSIEQAIRSYKWQRFKKRLIKTILYFGFDDYFLIARRIKKNAIPDSYIAANNLRDFAIRNVPEFILAPRDFDFPDAPLHDYRHYVGFMTAENRNEENLADDAENLALKTLFAAKAHHHFQLIYCSFGTVEPKKHTIIFSFLEKLIEATREQNWLLLISFDVKQKPIPVLATSDRVHIFRSVPQLQILKHADLFLTHGGLNSIKEAVHAEVPMLAYPVHHEFDPNGNTARLVYHGLGLAGQAETDSIEEIRSKIQTLLQNSQYKTKIQTMKARDALFTTETFLKLFASITSLRI
jgi:UDP:flavonoid glycosyltransferase YjiC (YdhE family)